MNTRVPIIAPVSGDVTLKNNVAKVVGILGKPIVETTLGGLLFYDWIRKNWSYQPMYSQPAIPVTGYMLTDDGRFMFADGGGLMLVG